jgi:hypothetical protein
MGYDKFLRSCKVLSATKFVWTKGASSRPIRSERFLIRFWFMGNSTMEMVRYGSKRECESFAYLYSKKLFTEKDAIPWRVTVEFF